MHGGSDANGEKLRHAPSQDPQWLCPLCHARLREGEGALRCDAGHHFDMAKQGYVNLLLANHKRSKNPGDDASMIAARRAFLRGGHYDFLMDAIVEQLLLHPQCASERFCRILDVGCGEGAYLASIRRALAGHWETDCYGMDISKSAIQKAASDLKCTRFAVASSYRIPLADHSVDWALSVFAPFDENEIARVLKPNGKLLRVSAAERHLFELKSQLYADPRLHDKPSPLAKAQVTQEIRVSRQHVLANEALRQLLAMTPLHWRGDAQAKARLLGCDAIEMSFDFWLQVIDFDHRE